MCIRDSVWAVEADSHAVALYTRGAFAHPADALPRPALEGTNALHYAWHVDELESPDGPFSPLMVGCGVTGSSMGPASATLFKNFLALLGAFP
eukprot:6691315-Pyramimonas_sp.AAC.1